MFRALLKAVKHAVEGRSPQWRGVRAKHLSIHPTCAACGGVKDLEVHHLVPFHIDAQLELVVDNLLTLCEAKARGCHYRVGHSWDWTAWNMKAVADAAIQRTRMAEKKTGL